MTNEQLYLAETVSDYIRGIKGNDWFSDKKRKILAQLREDAVCKYSPIGEYKCYTQIRFSVQSGKDPICVDTCLQDEIYNLIKNGVATIGCCCGHGKKEAYIQVSPQSVQKMHDLGYEAIPEKPDGQGKWCFKPKTFFLEPADPEEGE